MAQMCHYVIGCATHHSEKFKNKFQHHHPLNKLMEVLCANIELELKKILKTVGKHAFLTMFFQSFPVFLSSSILAQFQQKYPTVLFYDNSGTPGGASIQIWIEIVSHLAMWISYFFILIHQIFMSKMHYSAAPLLVLNVRFDSEKLSSRNLVFFCQFAEPFGKGYLFISWPPGLVSKDTRSSDKNLPR